MNGTLFSLIFISKSQYKKTPCSMEIYARGKDAPGESIPKELPTNKLYTVRRIFAEMQGAKTAACWRHARFFVTQTFGKKTRNV